MGKHIGYAEASRLGISCTFKRRTTTPSDDDFECPDCGRDYRETLEIRQIEQSDGSKGDEHGN